MNCQSCTRALQIANHRDYQRDCPGCGIRQLAHMGAEDRERMLDKLCHLCGPAARARVRQELRVEMARIKKLKLPGAGRARKEKAPAVSREGPRR